MEDKYLYPGDSVVPLIMADSYREFYISDILKLHNMNPEFCQMVYAIDKNARRTAGEFEGQYCVAVLWFNDYTEYIALAPVKYHFPKFRNNFTRFSEEIGYGESRVMPLMRFSELVVRYYLSGNSSWDNPVILRPVWSSAADSLDGKIKTSMCEDILNPYDLIVGPLCVKAQHRHYVSIDGPVIQTV